MSELTETVATDYKPLPSPFIHPVTGVTHVRIDTGWEPEMLSCPGLSLKRWRTCVLVCPPGTRTGIGKSEFDLGMQRLAEGLSQITGDEIRWHHVLDSCCNCYGDYGWFVVKKKEVKT
jgi:hypothetical protein